MKAILLNDFTKAFLFGFLCYLSAIIIFNEPIYSKAVFLVSTTFYLLNERIHKLETKLKKWSAY